MAQVNVGIVGLGRASISFALALRALNQKANPQHTFTIVGFDPARANRQAAAALKALDREANYISDAVQDVDLVWLQMPPDDVEESLKDIGPNLKAGAVVLNACALKGDAIGWSERHFPKNASGQNTAYLVGFSPMVGPDHLGDPLRDPEKASADYFSGGAIIISPSVQCPPEAVQLASDITEMIGVRAHFLDPHEYDGLIGGTEHLPVLAQLAVFEAVSKSHGWPDAQWVVNPTFFLSTHMLLTEKARNLAVGAWINRENTLPKLNLLIESLTNLRNVLEDGEQEDLTLLYEKAAQAYETWASHRRSNRWPGDDEPLNRDEMRAKSLLGNLFGASKPGLGKDKEKDNKERGRGRR
jgi:prephenate dehydrogenase